MAFFDEISKKITSAGEGAVNKGKAFADVSRLNSAISEEEKKIDSLYLQIGKLYTTLHSQDCDAELRSMVNAVLSSQQKISELKQQVQDIKGIVKCEKCGAQVPNNTAFCSSCGSPMPRREKPVLDTNHMLCDNCGAVIEKHVRFCTSCGKVQYNSAPVAPATVPSAPAMPVEAPAPVIPSAAENTPEAIPAAQKAPQKSEPVQDSNCPSCGATIRGNLKFCTTCGYSLDAPVQSNAPVADTPPTPKSIEKPVAADNKCPSCGAEIRSNLKFCTTCGYSLDVPPSNDSPVDVYSSSKGIENSDTGVKKCASCGATVNDGFAFCVECGKSVN